LTEIKNLFDIGITIKEPEKTEILTENLKGLKFCFTGAIQSIKSDGKRFTRDDMHELVIQNGGKVLDSVKKDLDFLVLADPSSKGKIVKAKEMGIKLIDEEEFFKMLRGEK